MTQNIKTTHNLLSINIGAVIALALFVFSCSIQENAPATNNKSWLAGDHHIHSRYSVGWDRETDPPTPIIAGDAIYPIPMNALMAKYHGLDWMVATDHGGPNHSKVNLEKAYPELLSSREVVPDLIQFYGMELNTPGGTHSSIIIPRHEHEHTQVYEIESGFDTRDKHPRDPSRHTEEKMLEALEFMQGMPLKPVLIANHPSRGTDSLGGYSSYHPEELRNWNDTAPRVAVGMEGAPGHQANAINPDGSNDPEGSRGGYRTGQPTLGGFDQMTAILGGFWDSMLGEGRRWSITSTSDHHIHWRDGGSDFWPGEYSKTYVYGENTYDGILEGLRNAHVFVTTGDLISELYVTGSSYGATASIGEALPLQRSGDVDVTIRIRDLHSSEQNAHGDTPQVGRVDLIVGEINGPVSDRSQGTNPTTTVERRFTADDWVREGDYLVMTHTLENVHHSSYFRVRGTNNTDELEPESDPVGEDPWTDLWFYSNPVFIEMQ
ncbi:MAG: hypothetical protein WD267_03200 [Balneolales bacterium]